MTQDILKSETLVSAEIMGAQQKMDLPSIDSLQKTTEKSVGFIEWLVDQIRKKSWVSLLMLLDCVIVACGNPKVLAVLIGSTLGDEFLEKHPIPPDYWIYWLVTVAGIFLLAFIIAYITLPKTALPGPNLNERSAIKGLSSFGFNDDELFERLGRTRVIRDVLNALCDSGFRFGILSGESGCGKSSFLQAGIWPRLEARKHQALYVQCNELQPLDSIRYAIHVQFAVPHEQLQTLDLAPLLELAANCEQQSEPPKTLILILDQFEQFFTHQRHKEDRKPFVEALNAWYRQQPPHPAKILVSLRSDLAGRMIELQNALGYTLGPNQNFMLEKFEPGEAADVFRVIIEQETIECDPSFIEELCADELANPRDGLVSPVDLQILAWMIAGREASERSRFDRTAFQRFGGLEGLLNRFLERILKSRETEERRQAALKLLLALIDLDTNLRAGVLTESELQQKLTASLPAVEVSEALQWLSRSDVRLVTPRPKGEEPGFELAHERIIAAVRHLAGQALTEVDQANQLLQRRVNEWLGNDRSARNLLSWRELRQILKQQPYLIWQPGERQKKALIDRSRRHYHYGLAGIAGLLLLCAVGYGLSTLPSVQMWQIKRALIKLNEQARKPEIQKQSALALVTYGAWDQAMEIANRIDSTEKAETLQALAKSAVELNDPVKAAALLDKLRVAAEKIADARTKALTLQALAQSAVELNDPVKAAALLDKLRVAAEKIADARYKANTLQALAQSAVELNEPDQAAALLDKLREAAEKIADAGYGAGYKAETLQALAKSAVELNDPDQAAALLDKAQEAAEKIADARTKADTLQALAKSALELEQPGKAAALLGKAQVVAEKIADARTKALTLQALAKSALELNEPDQAAALLDKAQVAANRINDALDKADTLQALAKRAVELNEPGKAAALLDKLRVAAEKIYNARTKSRILR